MSCVESAVPAQVPGPDQYWEHIKSKDRAYFIGRDPDGLMVWQCEGDCIEVGNLDWSGWRHIPGCTGWDWEPDQAEEFPQYWTTLATPSSSIAYIKRIDQSTIVSVCKDGTEVLDSVIEWKTDRRTRLTEQQALALLDTPADRWPKYYVPTTSMVTNRSDSQVAYFRRDREYVHDETNGETFLIDGASFVWNEWNQLDNVQEVTEAEAKARVTKAAEPTIEVRFLPVAPEMDWVVQDRVPARNNIDEWAWCKRGRSPGHFYNGFGGWSGTIMHGHVDGDEVLHLRCRRKDLPVVESPEDFVAQDIAPARPGIDVAWFTEIGVEPRAEMSAWWPVRTDGSEAGKMHGTTIGTSTVHLACKRKDLPPVPAPVEETFPQWYILKESEIRSWVPRWAIKRTGEETCIRYVMDGVEVLQSREPWTGGCEAWECCTATEAYDRLGTGILPAVPPEPRRVPVKLWVTYRLNDEGGDWPVRATAADQTCQNWKEIQFDGNGAFIEVEQ